MAAYEEAIDAIEAALRERYHVPTLDGVGTLGAAVSAARSGDLEPLAAALEGREMYRWGPVVADALTTARETVETPAKVLPVVSKDEASLAEPKTTRHRT